MKVELFDVVSITNGLLGWSLAAFAIVAFGAILDRVVNRTSASFRHAIWLGSSICILATPVLAYWIPGILPGSLARDSIGSSATHTVGELPFRPSALLQGNYNSENTKTAEPAVIARATATELSAELVISQEVRYEENLQAAWATKQSLIHLLYRCIVCVWVSGIIIYLARIARARTRLNAAFCERNRVADEPLLNLVSKLASEEGYRLVSRSCGVLTGVGARRIGLTVSKSDVGPLVWGLLPVQLLLPVSLAELPVEAQSAAIRHEFAHVARGDEWVRRYLVLLRAIFWFHPLVRFCCNQVQLFAEKACDDYVLRHGHLPSLYSTMLLKLGQRQTDISPGIVITCMAQSQIASRIHSILQANVSRHPTTRRTATAIAAAMLIATSAISALRPSTIANDPVVPQSQAAEQPDGLQKLKVGPKDWPQWGGTSARNNTSTGAGIPLDWDIKTGRNVRWSMPLGTQAYGGTVVANGKVFTGANNGSGYLKRFPKEFDLGVLLCFNESDGSFLWQHSNTKLPTGRVHDWPSLGVCSAPLVDGDRLWYVTNRGEVVCLDTEGFRDGQNDGPFDREEVVDENEADVVWVFDMMKQLGVSQHNMANCSVTCAGDMLFVNTSQGVDESHIDIPSQTAPSFLCLSRSAGGVLWTDNSPGNNILHGQWSSPAYAVLGGVPQVIFGGGDGYLYSFLAQGENGKSKLLWKFDCNPKDAIYVLGGGATRNYIVATPVIYDGLVYVGLGEDPEHGEGKGHVWCVDPTKRGDVSPTLVFNSKALGGPIAHKRLQALQGAEGDFEKPNPNSAAVWHYVGSDSKSFEKAMHRTLSTVAIKNDLLFVPDFSGLLHCLDAKTGKTHWIYDMFAACWASPLIVDDRVYVTDEDGEVAVFKLSSKMELMHENSLNHSIYTTPIVANDTLFISNQGRLWALQEGAQSDPEK